MSDDENVWTVVVGGGTGTRFGGPKQYEMLGDRRVIDHAVGTAASVGDGVVVVLPPADAAREGAVPGGTTRSESVRNGLGAVPSSATIVCVHDAARPFASADLFRAVVSAVSAGSDGAVPGVPVTDTVKLVVEDSPGADAEARVVVETLPRDRLVAVQTPQAFRATTLRSAHAAGHEATDDAALVERAGGTVVVVPGEPMNRKITHPADLDWARSHIGTSP
ncbi:2-C-methyl-D-erythritol 4-phosphate cytidylyltransferase [soil metagenome]